MNPTVVAPFVLFSGLSSQSPMNLRPTFVLVLDRYDSFLSNPTREFTLTRMRFAGVKILKAPLPLSPGHTTSSSFVKIVFGSSEISPGIATTFADPNSKFSIIAPGGFVAAARGWIGTAEASQENELALLYPGWISIDGLVFDVTYGLRERQRA